MGVIVGVGVLVLVTVLVTVKLGVAVKVGDAVCVNVIVGEFECVGVIVGVPAALQLLTKKSSTYPLPGLPYAAAYAIPTIKLPVKDIDVVEPSCVKVELSSDQKAVKLLPDFTSLKYFGRTVDHAPLVSLELFPPDVVLA